MPSTADQNYYQFTKQLVDVKPAILFKVDDTESFTEKLATQGLKLVEVYSNAWGPCYSILPTLKRIKIERDPDPAAFQYDVVSNAFSRSRKLLHRENTTLFNVWHAWAFSRERNSLSACIVRPTFHTINNCGLMGARYLTQCQAEFIEPLEQYRGLSKPTFLFYRVRSVTIANP
eukprot:2548909-Pyramimonas_sp.AAC.1